MATASAIVTKYSRDDKYRDGILVLIVPVVAIALIYMFGNQGYMKELMFGYPIRAPIGIVISLVFWIFPHVVILFSTALSTADGRLYEAAKVLRTKSIRTFF